MGLTSSTAVFASVPFVVFFYLYTQHQRRSNAATHFKMSSGKSTIVVVGGGAAGAQAVRALSTKLDASKHRLVLITARNKFLYLPAALRTLVSDQYSEGNLFMPYDTLFGSFPGELKIDTAVSVESAKDGKGGKVVLASAEEVNYDILILATGSSWEGLVKIPNEEKEYLEYIQSWRKKFKDAQNIVIVGGGAVGIETAGEIKDIYPKKSVTIVHDMNYLLSSIYPDKFRKDMERRLRLRGVEVITDDLVDDASGSDDQLKTRSGKSLRCDLMVAARGGKPNANYLSSLQPSPLSDRGYVKVEPTLQVQGYSSIFALGDMIDWPEAKQFAKVNMGHMTIVTANVMAQLQGQKPAQVYKGAKELIVITNGKNGGGSFFGILWGVTLGDFFSRLLKSNDLMVPQTRKSLGLPAIA